MRIGEVVNQILDYIPNIDVTKSAQPASLFETIIRYLSGMISAYDLLKTEEFSDLTPHVVTFCPESD
jgi:Glycosyl hydrolase family 47